MCFRFFLFCAGLYSLGAQSLAPQWKLALGAPPSGPPVVFAGGVAVTLGSGRVAYVDENGKETASAKLDQAPAGPAVVDGTTVYAADVWGSIYSLRLNGERNWKYVRETRAGNGYSTLVLADVDGDGSLDPILTDTRGRLYAVSSKGKLIFEIAATTYRLSTPAVGDLDGDGRPDFLFGADDETVYCVSGKGHLLWSRKLPGGRFGRALPAIADLDMDGKPEVYIATPFVGRQTGLHSLDAATGTPRWHVKSEMQTYASLQFLDLNGDGKKDVLFGDKNTQLYAVDSNGKKIWGTQLGGRGIFYAGAAAGDRIFQIVRDTGLDGKSLYALDLQGKVRESIAMDGGGSYGPAITKQANGLRLYAVSNRGTVHAYGLPDAPVRWASWRNSPASNGFYLPATTARAATAAPGTPAERRAAQRGTNVLPGAAPRSFRVDRPDGSRLVVVGGNSFGIDRAGEYRVYLDSAAKPIVYAATDAPLALRFPATEFGDAVAARFRSAYAFALKHPSVERFDAIHAEIREAETLFPAIAGKPAADVLIRQLENPWGSARTYRAQLVLKMLGNEYEGVGLAVTNLRAEPAQIRITTDAPFVELRDVQQVRPESTGRLTEDVLPKLNESSTLSLAPGETKKIWAIVHSRSLPAGSHKVSFRAGNMFSLEKPQEIVLPVEVSKARLPEKRVYHQCQWLYLASIADPKAREATIVDALEHGMNVFPIPTLTYPVSPDGTLGAPESKLHDELVTRLKGKGVFLVGGSVGLQWPKDFQPSEAANDAAYTAALRQYAAHMTKLGLSFEDWAYYYMDEPGLVGKDAAFDKYVRDITRVKKAEPRARIYANPAGGARPEMLEPLTKLVDIWQPDIHLVREHPEEYKKIFQTGTYWHYEAPADQRNLDTLGYYRMKPWVSFQMGMTGGGYWVYSFSQFWSFEQNMATEYGTVYQTPQGPVTTKRWEASRDGSEDFELLWNLRELARAKQDTATLQLIDEAVAYVTKGQEKVSDISRQVEPIAPDYERWTKYRADLIAAWERML
ncbi:MAG TPA: PQQ-binding-like beta-propeller repeat protein [Bryobacteraceae bacterium]|nr:PQQ-binding-like beta-propeller repeat protein [Bryobacteraceae bacterium]